MPALPLIGLQFGRTSAPISPHAAQPINACSTCTTRATSLAGISTFPLGGIGERRAVASALARSAFGGGVVLPIIAAYTIGVYWIFRGKVCKGYR